MKLTEEMLNDYAAQPTENGYVLLLPDERDLLVAWARVGLAAQLGTEWGVATDVLRYALVTVRRLEATSPDRSTGTRRSRQ